MIDPAGGAGRLTWVRFPSPASPFHIQPSAARYPLPIRLADSNRADHECDAQLARSRARGMGRAADGGVTVAARQDARSVPRSTISRLAPCLRRGHHHFGEPASDYGLAGKTRWVFRALNVTYAANCAMSSSDTVTGSFITTHCTPSVQGGVVSDPTYR